MQFTQSSWPSAVYSIMTSVINVVPISIAKKSNAANPSSTMAPSTIGRSFDFVSMAIPSPKATMISRVRLLQTIAQC